MTNRAFEDLAWWIENDVGTTRRLVRLIRELQKDPFEGTGKPEPLKHNLAGVWSRRINQEHRLLYVVNDKSIKILSARYHY